MTVWHGLEVDIQTIIVRGVLDFDSLVITIPKRGDIEVYQYQCLEGDDTNLNQDYDIMYDFWDREDERYTQRFNVIGTINIPEDLKRDGDIYDLDELKRYVTDTVTQNLLNDYYYKKLLRITQIKRKNK